MTMPAGDPTDEILDAQVRESTRDESWAMLDADTRRYLGISAGEFVRRYNAGEWPEPDDDLTIMRLAFHLEGLQQEPATPC